MTEITNFQDLRVGRKFPVCLDVYPISNHVDYGIFAVAYDMFSGKEIILQLRRSGKRVALFVFQKGFMEKLPETWKNSKLLWTNKPRKVSK